MCGISVLVGKKCTNLSSELVTLMNEAVVHRGPDGEGIFIHSNLGLGHRRLSIIDLDVRSNQPMSYMDRYTISYNGEIYNYLELRADLIKFGYYFSTESDTEVILASYDYWGEECVSQFNGMWAFAIHDLQAEKVFFSRDRFGIKPLYYSDSGEYFCAGSEIKQLLNFCGRKINWSILSDFLVCGLTDHSSETFFESIRKVLPGHNMVYDLRDNSIEVYCYYEIKHLDTKQECTDDDFQKKFQEELSRSINYRLRSDVKVGTCLSGGLDSSSVALLASEQYSRKAQNKFCAITAVAEDPQLDESDFAKLVASGDKFNWKTVKPSREEFWNSIEKVVETQEEPFGGISIFMQYFVMQEAAKMGCKVMLDGQGGDETLFGYERYYPAYFIESLRESGVVGILSSLKSTNNNNSKMSMTWTLVYMVGGCLSWLRRIIYYRRCNFVKKPYRGRHIFLSQNAKAMRDIINLQKLEISSTNLPQLLRFEDKNSMRHSVEARLPFLDWQLLEFSLGLPTRLKVRDGWTKYILRALLNKKRLPAIAWRKNKLGFNAPDSLWLRGSEDAMIKEIEKSNLLSIMCNMAQIKRKFNKMDFNLRWRLYNVAVWERLYGIKST